MVCPRCRAKKGRGHGDPLETTRWNASARPDAPRVVAGARRPGRVGTATPVPPTLGAPIRLIAGPLGSISAAGSGADLGQPADQWQLRDGLQLSVAVWHFLRVPLDAGLADLRGN